MDNLDEYTDEDLIEMYVRWLRQEMETCEREQIIQLLQCSMTLDQHEDKEELTELYLSWLKEKMKTWTRIEIILSLRSSVIMDGDDLPVS